MVNITSVYQSVNNEYDRNSIYIENTPKVWYTHYRGYIVKSWLEPVTNRIIQEKIPYNQPNHYLEFLDNYFKYNLK
jgi:hypothetical protein